MPADPVIGVLALQGDVREHLTMLTSCGARAIAVRRRAELDTADALVIPGGESTTMVRLAVGFALVEPIRARLHGGMPALGTCAGMIMLADRLLDGTEGQGTLGGLDVAVRRNAFGRQVDSFEAEVDFHGLDDGGPLHAVFIRAPVVEEIGPGVEVLARIVTGGHGPGPGRIVAVRQGPVMATSFHPEITGDARVHRFFVDLVRAAPVGSRDDASR